MEYDCFEISRAKSWQSVSREMLLSRVWGYDYYGGARTVDVHVRRLRANSAKNMLISFRPCGRLATGLAVHAGKRESLNESLYTL